MRGASRVARGNRQEQRWPMRLEASRRRRIADRSYPRDVGVNANRSGARVAMLGADLC